jgi:DnaJ-domain-containing protein 1
VFIVWRKRPVKGKGGGPFLLGPLEYRNADVRTSYHCELRCEHGGAGRVAWTPLLMIAERVDGRPRQRVLQRFPTIRSCCIGDQFNRAAWWYDVTFRLDTLPEWADGPLYEHLARDRRAMVRKLREVVPRPTPRAREDFEAFRVKGKAERDAIFEEAIDDYIKQHGGRKSTMRDLLRGSDDPTCFAVLGLGPDAMLDEVKGRYRDLAKRHHPDRGGDAAEFNRIVAAYDEACGLLAGRAPA